MKLLIADDDEQIRSGIKEGIDWAALDIKEVITASNGLDALQRFNEHLPEIVITDVRMPGIDGMELLRRIKEISPQTRVVILSGYNDFEYLKKAIQLAAVDYEMKPIRIRRLIALIQKMKEDILRDQVSEQVFNKYLESYKSNFVEDLLTGGISDRQIILEELEKYFHFNAKGILLCVCIQIDLGGKNDYSDSKVAMDTMHRLFVSSDLTSRGICLRAKGWKLFLLLRIETTSYMFYQQFVNELKIRLRTWNHEVLSVCQTQFSAGISTPGSASDLVKIFIEAEKALSLRLYEGRNSIIVNQVSMNLSDRPISGLLENEEFKLQLVRNDFISIAEAIHNDFARLKKERKHSKKSVVSYCRNLFQLLLSSVKSVTDDLNEYIQSKLEIIEDDTEFITLQDYADFVLTVFRETGTRLSRDAALKRSAAMARADEFIRQNFTRELTVEEIADYVDKTPNYFSSLFKKEFGISFKDYVNRLRVSKAKEILLNTNDLIYEISEKVGFSNYTYFTRVFKKVEGYSPTLLRKKVVSSSDESEKSI